MKKIASKYVFSKISALHYYHYDTEKLTPMRGDYTTTTTKYYRRRISSGESTLEDPTTEITIYYRTLQATILLKNITQTSHHND